MKSGWLAYVCEVFLRGIILSPILGAVMGYFVAGIGFAVCGDSFSFGAGFGVPIGLVLGLAYGIPCAVLFMNETRTKYCFRILLVVYLPAQIITVLPEAGPPLAMIWGVFSGFGIVCVGLFRVVFLCETGDGESAL